MTIKTRDWLASWLMQHGKHTKTPFSVLDLLLAVGTETFSIVRFCGESHTLLIGDKIGRRAADNCADRKSLVYSYLCESVATIDHRRGHYHNAYDYHNRALQVRKNCTQTPPYLLAEGYSAVGRTLYGLWRNAESLEMLNRAVEIMDSVPPEERLTFNPDRYLRNLSRSTAALGRFEEAKAYAAAADKCQTEMYGPGSHFHGE